MTLARPAIAANSRIRLRPRRARARRFPSCIAATLAMGISWPAETSSAGRCCGSGSSSAHTSRPASRRAAVATVKSAGRTPARSAHGTGNDTGVPGRIRGLYAATTVAPPALVGSINTLPPRSSRMNAVVARSGSRSPALAAIARVAAAASGPLWPGVSGTNTCTPLAPLVFTAPASPAESSADRTSMATATALPKSSADGGSMSRTMKSGLSEKPTRIKVG